MMCVHTPPSRYRMRQLTVYILYPSFIGNDRLGFAPTFASCRRLCRCQASFRCRCSPFSLSSSSFFVPQRYQQQDEHRQQQQSPNRLDRTLSLAERSAHYHPELRHSSPIRSAQGFNCPVSNESTPENTGERSR